MKRFIALLSIWLLVFGAPAEATQLAPDRIPIHASAWLHPGSAVPACSGGGISGSNSNDSFYDPILFSTVQQDGATTNLPSHPMPVCVPGQDYHVGYNTTLTLLDPQANPPSGCSYIAPGTRHGPEILCNSTGSIAVGSATVGYDFTGAISAVGQPIALEFGSNFLGSATCTVMNNKFLTNASSSYPPIVFGGLCARVVQHNQFDGGGLTMDGTQFAIVDNSCSATPTGASTATLDVEYNAFKNWWQPRIMGSGCGGGAARTVKYNFARGLNDQVSAGVHGEFDLFGGQCTGGTPCPGYSTGYVISGCIEWSDNFIVWNETAPADNTSTFFASTGATSYYQVGCVKVEENTIVTNKNTSGGTNVRDAILGINFASAGNVSVQRNYVSTSGAQDCMLNGATGAVTNFTTKQDDGTGTGTPGNVLTIAAFPSSGWVGTTGVQPGMNVTHPGSTTTTILSYGTASGSNGIGTYNVDGPAQLWSSDTTTQITPGITSLTVAGNVSLNTGAAITASLPSLSGSC